MTAACALALLVAPLRGQDDGGTAPPAPDMSAPPPPDASVPPAPDSSAPAPDDSASFQTFYDALGNQGTWIQSSDYGYVWQPQETDPDWAPYTEGSWAYTDAGWTWVSAEPWGWATYHYGRWVNLAGTGWCWVPGYTWAPAWVSWRYGGGYAGWAPLPPDSFVGIDYSDDGLAIGLGFHIGGDCDSYYGIGAGWYNFVPVSCLGYRSYHGYYRNRRDNYALINHTINVTSINVKVNAGGAAGFSRVTTGGPMLAQVNAVAQTPVPRVSLFRSNRPGGGGTLAGNSLAIYAPRLNPGRNGQPPRVAGTIGPAVINRGTDITRPLAVNRYLTPPPATEAQVQEARLALLQAPGKAKVLTDGAKVNPVLQGRLTDLKPVTSESAPSRTFNTSPSTMPGRAPSTAGATQTPRTYPQTGDQGRVYTPGPVYSSSPPAAAYAPHSAAPSTTPAPGGSSGVHYYVAPSAPAGYPTAGSSPRQGAGGSPGAGYPGSAGGSRPGGYPGGAGGNQTQPGGAGGARGPGTPQQQTH